MNQIKYKIVKLPVVGWLVLFLYKLKILFMYHKKSLKNIASWLFKSQEITNFTYDLTKLNKLYLAAMISDITGCDLNKILAFIEEIENDVELKRHVKKYTEMSEESYVADKDAKFAKRIGWYVFVRAIKPKVVVETGIDKGLGSCVLAAAIKRNVEEGYDGYYYGTDINLKAGYLLDGVYKKHGEILYGDSIESLKKLNKTIDLFINDSDHSAEYEKMEYETIINMIADNAIILGDNSHTTDKLYDFAMLTDRHFLFFKEEPKEHWYPGGGIGIAFTRK